MRLRPGASFISLLSGLILGLFAARSLLVLAFAHDPASARLKQAEEPAESGGTGEEGDLADLLNVPVLLLADTGENRSLLPDYSDGGNFEAQSRLLWRRQALLEAESESVDEQQQQQAEEENEEELEAREDEARLESLVAPIGARSSGAGAGDAPDDLAADYDFERPQADAPMPREHYESNNFKQESVAAYARYSQHAAVDVVHLESKEFRPKLGQKIGPHFTKEPPSFIHYLNSSDLIIPCAASGDPEPSISWWHMGAQVEAGSLLERRYVRYDNSLVISAFKGGDFEPDIHSTTYRCQASNSLGTIVSRDVVINAVIDQDYEASVADQFVTADNDALFRCKLPPQARDLFQVVGWLEDEQHLIGPTQLASIGGPGTAPRAWPQVNMKHQQPEEGRTLLLPEGQLYLQRVQLRHSNKSYRCQLKNLLTSALSLSPVGGRLYVTETTRGEPSDTAPRIVDPPRPISVAKLNEPLLLTCLAQGSPRPTLRWFRWQTTSSSANSAHQIGLGKWTELTNGGGPGNNETLTSRFVISPEANLLLIKSLQLADHRARFKCLANNSFGSHQAETELRLELWPANKLVELEPRLEYIGGSGDYSDTHTMPANSQQRQLSAQITLNCTVHASSQWPVVAIEWLKDGWPIFGLSLPQYSPAARSYLATAPILPDQPPSASNASLAVSSAAGQWSIFEDSDQEISAVEYYYTPVQPTTNSADSEDEMRDGSANVAMNADKSDERQTLNSLVTHQGHQARFRITSSSLNKMTRNYDDHTSGSLSWAQEEGKIFKRLEQSARLINRETLLYQLHLNQLKRHDRGSYQCRARCARSSVHATSQLLLKDTPPKFVETFSAQLLRPLSGTPAVVNEETGAGSNQIQANQELQASLKCVASGSPLPEIAWSLSGFMVPESSRFRVGDYVTRDGLIISFVNITNVQAEDGGMYECSATNEAGQIRHSAWLNVTGAPFVRPMPNVSATAGHSLSMMCPVGGWPIEQIIWFQNTSKLPVNHRQKLFPNGTLTISELNEVTDSGEYSCQARSAPNGDQTQLVASNYVRVNIKVPPVVEPFAFTKSLHRGQRYNIMCTVVRGDLPVTIRWFKDGRPLEMTTAADGSDSETIAIKQLDPYSSTLTFASLQGHHRGLYSCEATNEAGRANQSSTLVIHMPPEWRIEPRDMSVTVGKTAVIDCQADAFPAARIEWRLSQDLFREPPTEFKPIISSLYMRVFENGSLIIYNTQRTDAGHYLCQANNGVGPGLSRVIKLTAHVAAHFKSKIRTELVRSGQPARLRCESIGDPPVEIQWLRDKAPLYVPGGEIPISVPQREQQVLSVDRYTLTRTTLQDGLLSELNIAKTERSDSALFTCITQNQFGSDDTNIQLIVQSAPEPPGEIRVHEYEARSVKVSWVPGHTGNSPISKYVIMYAPITSAQNLDVMGGQLSLERRGQQAQQAQTFGHLVNVSVPGNESSAMLQNLTPLTEYQLYLVAYNSIGSSRAPANNNNEPIKFRTEDEAPSAMPMAVKAQALSSRTIKVKWRAPERRFHFGSVAGFYVGYKPTREAAKQIESRPNSDLGTFIYKTVEFGVSAFMGTVGDKVNMELECLLTGLRRGQSYLIMVQPFNGRGTGPASEPVLAETWRVDVPEAPILKLVLRNTHSIHLAWRVVRTSNSPVYSLAASEDDDGNDEINNKNSDELLAHNSQQNSATPHSSRSSNSRRANEVDNNESDQTPTNEPILGFILTRRQLLNSARSQVFIMGENGAENHAIPELVEPQPVETRLPSDHHSHIVDNLTCGTKYQFTIVALNSVGASAPSEPLTVKTEGSTPVAPDKSSLLPVNSSSVLLNLAAWHNGACTMRSFEIMLKASRSRKWNQVANLQLEPNDHTQKKPNSNLAPTNSFALEGVSISLASNQSAVSAASVNTSLLVQRSTHSHLKLANHQHSNSSLILADLIEGLNYDLKVVATNEAGSTEALYTFNTNNGASDLMAAQTPPRIHRGSLGRSDEQWSSGSGVGLSDAQFALGQDTLELLSSPTGTIRLTWLLLLIMLSALFLSAGCLLLARYRRSGHRRAPGSTSACSSLSPSVPRSNQSATGHYYTTTGEQLVEKCNGRLQHQAHILPVNDRSLQQHYERDCIEGTLERNRQEQLRMAHNMMMTAQMVNEDGHRSQSNDPVPQSSGPMQLYGANEATLGRHYGAPVHLTLTSGSGGDKMVTNSNYAYLALNKVPERQENSNNIDAPIGNLMIESEPNMCAGTSTLANNNVAISDTNQDESNTNNDELRQRRDYSQATQPLEHNQQLGYPMSPNGQTALVAKNLSSQVSKFLTLPANCRQRAVQQLIRQQQQQQDQSQKQQVSGGLLAANIMQPQQCNGLDDRVQVFLNSFQANNSNEAGEASGTVVDNLDRLACSVLEQELQQQVYATVKRGCPRAPRLCDFAIYQCPQADNNQAHNHEAQQQQQQEQQQLSLLGCCASNGFQTTNTVQDSVELTGQQQACCQQTVSEQQICAHQLHQQKQQATNDYQQLGALT